MIGLPSIVLAAGFVFFYDLPAVYRVLPIYDTQWLLLAGYIVGFSPIAIRMLHGPLAQAGRTGYDAGRAHGSSALRAWARAVLSLIWRSVVSVWLFMVAVIMFELPLSEIVSVAVQLKSEVVTGAALTVVGIAAVIAVIAAVSGLLWLATALHRTLRISREAAVESLIAELPTAGAPPQPRRGPA